MNSLIKYINSLISTSQDLINEIQEVSIEHNYTKKSILIENLATCENLYFIEKGLVRAYYYHNGKEITDWFGMENMIIGPIVRRFPIKQTKHSVEILEDATLVSVSFKNLEQLYAKYHEMERIGRLIAIQSMLHIQRKLDNLQLLDAKQRYEQFLLDYPSLIQRAPLNMISSYLDMNQVTLSRVRHSV